MNGYMAYRFFSVLAIIFAAGIPPLAGQSVKTNVTLKLERLNQEKRFELQGFDANIKHYIESQRWTDGRIPFELELEIEIVIDRIQPSFEEVFYGQMFIASKTTGYKKVDKEWRFAYRVNQPLIFDPNLFDSFTSLFDYYIFIIIGELLDRFDRFGGEQYFNQAYAISQLGQSDRYNRWWDRREQYVLDYLHESHLPFREMTQAFDAARYWLLDNNEEERKLAANAAFELLKKVARDPDEKDFMKDFFSREYTRLAAVYISDSLQYSTIMEIDSDHTDFYKNFRAK